jgi:Tautomerase enzyme
MPLVRVDALAGRTQTEVTELLDAIHRALVAAFGIPLRDRYQVYAEHDKARFRIEDSGLGIPRSDRVMFVSLTSRPRTDEEKLAFYKGLVRELATCGVDSNDVAVSITTNTDADWSFGLGRAQFVTGELDTSHDASTA